MEEGIMRGVKSYKHSKGRKYSRRKQHLAVCSSPNCNIVCHTCCPKESKIRFLPQFATLSCFEIAHHHLCNNLFVEVRRKGKTYTWSIKNHSVCTMIKDIHKGELPRRSERRRGRPARNLHSITDVVQNDDDNMTNISMITPPVSPELLVTPTQQEQRRHRLPNTTTVAGARMTTTARKTRQSVENTTTTVRTTRQAVRKLQRTRNTTRKRSRRWLT